MAKKQQTSLPGKEYARKVVPELEAFEKEFTEGELAEKGGKEAKEAAAEKIATKMRELGIDVHKFTDADGEEVTIKAKPGKIKVTVKRKKPRQADEAEAN